MVNEYDYIVVIIKYMGLNTSCVRRASNDCKYKDYGLLVRDDVYVQKGGSFNLLKPSGNFTYDHV
jgi:hypothetical protein